MCGSPAIDFGYRDPGLLHKAKLSGLQPGLTYYYVCGDQQFGWSQEFSFRAATPANASASTRVVVYGGKSLLVSKGSPPTWLFELRNFVVVVVVCTLRLTKIWTAEIFYFVCYYMHLLMLCKWSNVVFFLHRYGEWSCWWDVAGNKGAAWCSQHLQDAEGTCKSNWLSLPHWRHQLRQRLC